MSEHNDHLIDPRWKYAHDTAEALRHALGALGVSAGELATLTLRADAVGAPLVALPPLRPESAERLLTGLGPSLGPHGPHLARPRLTP